MNRFGKWVALCVSIGALAAGGDALAFGNAARGGSEGAKAVSTSEPITVKKAKGTLYKDKDFGAGYLYKVIVEETTIKQ
jgi:hypothetical protein